MDMTVQLAEEVAPARDWRLYWVAGAIDRLGNQISAIAVPLLALAVTGSPVVTGVVGAAGLGGRLLAAPAAAVMADRYHRKWMMVTALLVAATALGAVTAATVTATLTATMLAAAAVVEGAAQACYEAAGAGAIRRVLPADVQRALSGMHARNQAVQIAGPVLGGLLFQVARWLPILADAISYLIAAAGVSAIGTDMAQRHSTGTPPGAALRTGLRFVWGQPLLRFVTVWAAGINLAFATMAFYAVLAAARHNAMPAATSLVLSIGSVGGLAGALLAPALIRRVDQHRLVPLASWAMVVVVCAMAAADQPWQYGMAFGAVTLLSPALGVTFQTRVIELTPDELQGRVSACMQFVDELLRLPAPLLAGVLAATCPPVAAALLLGCLVAALAWYATATGRQTSVAPQQQPASSWEGGEQHA